MAVNLSVGSALMHDVDFCLGWFLVRTVAEVSLWSIPNVASIEAFECIVI